MMRDSDRGRSRGKVVHSDELSMTTVRYLNSSTLLIVSNLPVSRSEHEWHLQTRHRCCQIMALSKAEQITLPSYTSEAPHYRSSPSSWRSLGCTLNSYHLTKSYFNTHIKGVIHENSLGANGPWLAFQNHCINVRLVQSYCSIKWAFRYLWKEITTKLTDDCVVRGAG